MRIYRYKHQGKIQRGVLKEEKLYPIRGSIYRKFAVGRSGVAISRVLLLPPVLPGKIVAVGRDLPVPAGTTLLDRPAGVVTPGLIDAHVHCFSTPNEGFTDATRSAAAGGVTTIIEMPYDQGRPVISREAFLDKRERLEAQSVVDVALLATIKKTGGLDQIPLMAEAGACGVKVSLYETDPNRFPRIPDAELLDAFRLVLEARPDALSSFKSSSSRSPRWPRTSSTTS